MKTNLQTRLEIIDKVESDEIPVYRCMCNSLSLDRLNWVIFMDTSIMNAKQMEGIGNTLVMPHYDKGHYTMVTCDLCKAFPYGVK